MNTTLPQSGEVFDFRYRIMCRLGRGADGYVFGATKLETGKRVAIKCWIGPHAEQALAAAQQFVLTAHEARLFDNPHIVDVHAAEAGHNVNYCVMDWLEGMTLGQRILRRRPSPLQDVFNIVVPCMRAIAEAHAAGIVHGDIRPGHIFVCQATRHRPSIARIFDFGRGFGLASVPSLVRDVGDEILQYATPEQLIGVPADSRSDTYAFGVMLFEMLAGERAFSADNSDELARKIKDGATRLLASISPSIPVRLAHIVERAMAVDPQLRWDNLAEMVEALEPFDPGGAPVFSAAPAARTVRSFSSVAKSPYTSATLALPSGQTERARAPRSSKTPPPPPPPRARQTVVSAAVPPPPPLPEPPQEDITTTSASWELTEPIRMRRFRLERLLARLQPGPSGRRVAAWCMVLMASMIAARAVQRMAEPAFEPASERQQAAPSLLEVEPPECSSVVGATDPRCAHTRSPQPTAAPLKPTTEWPRELGSGGGAPAVDAADSGMRNPAAPAPARAAPRSSARSRRMRTQEFSPLPVPLPSTVSLRRRDAEAREIEAAEDALDRVSVSDDRDEPARKAVETREPAPPRKRSANSARRSHAGDGAARTNDPFERLDRMHLQ